MKKSKNNIMEAYRRLLNIIESYKNSNIRCISITSNSDMEDKTIIAKNIASMLARNGENTLFIECSVSLLKDTKVKKNSKKNERGLVNILEYIDDGNVNNWKWKSYIEDTKFEYLSVLRLGTNDLNKYFPLFKTKYLKILMEKLKESFDYIILDIPSLENLSYAQIIASAADECIFVLKEGVNEIAEGKIIRDKLNKIGCKVLGCIFNKEKIPTELFHNYTGGKENVVCFDNSN